MLIYVVRYFSWNWLVDKSTAVFLEADINGINVYTLHPGVIKTELGRHISTIMQYLFRIFVQPFSKNPEQGAQTTIYCSVDEKLANETGLYYQ